MKSRRLQWASRGAYNEGQLWDDIGFSADDLPYQMYKTVVKVNGQPYDAETFTDSYGAKYTICYQGQYAEVYDD